MSGSHKQYTLPVYSVLYHTGVTTDLTSSVTEIKLKDNVTYQISWTGTLLGTFSIETSLDYVPNNNAANLAPLNAGTWDTVRIDSGAAASGSPGSGTIELNQLGAPFVRLKFTYTSGTGNLSVNIVGKVV